MRLIRRSLTVVLAMLFVTGLLSTLGAHPAAAETTREVGNYRLTLWFNTPTPYPDQPATLFIRVATLDGAPVAGLTDQGDRDSLMLHIGIRNQATQTIPAASVPDQPGLYAVNLLLPIAAPYDMQVLSRIGEQQVSERFISGKDGLEKVVVPPTNAYPRGSDWVVAVTFGAYLVGLAAFGVRAIVHRARRAPAAAGR